MVVGENAQSVLSIIHAMRHIGIAVNLIDANGALIDTAALWQQKTIPLKLNKLVKHADQYQWQLIEKRFVVFPMNPIWQQLITDVEIRNMPRLQATDQYIALVKQQVPQLSKLLEPMIKGDPKAPVYVELVTLSKEAPLVEHLVELLGDNRHLVFTVQLIHSGQHLLVYDVVADTTET